MSDTENSSQAQEYEGGAVENAIAVLIAFAVIVGACWAILAVIVRIGHWMSVVDETHHVTVTQLLSTAGFDPAKEYPLQLHGTLEGQMGSVQGDVQFSLLGGGGEVYGNIRPGSAVRIGITIGGSTWVVEQPMRNVEFLLHEDKSSVKFTVRDEVVSAVPVEYRYDASFWQFGRPVRQEVSLSSAQAWADYHQEGLAALLQDHLARVVISLPSAEYHSLFSR